MRDPITIGAMQIEYCTLVPRVCEKTYQYNHPCSPQIFFSFFESSATIAHLLSIRRFHTSLSSVFNTIDNCRSGITRNRMEDRPDATMSECHDDKIDENAMRGDCDSVSLQKGDEDLGSNNSATASISSSSTASLASSDDNNTSSSSMSISSDITSKSKNLWWIHGNGYDLIDFVESHPGGVEAILLGKGRDCTALVESYHAFSGESIWKTLEKYRSTAILEDVGETDGFSSAQGTEQRSGRVKDFFYEVLKERATKVLRAKGIDPVKDRGASKTRITYYLVVLVSWLYSGYLHCSVSFFIVPLQHDEWTYFV